MQTDRTQMILYKINKNTRSKNVFHELKLLAQNWPTKRLTRKKINCNKELIKTIHMAATKRYGSLFG